MSSLRILIADDHEVVRCGVRRLLEAQPDWTVVAEASTGKEAVEKAILQKPDVAILDITMPELNGLAATVKIRRELPQTEVLIMTMHESEQIAREVLVAGARGYVLKSDAGVDLVAAVDALRQHRPFFSMHISSIVLNGFLESASKVSTDAAITSREREILQSLAEGKSHKEIAASLNISVRTVETHRFNLMHKLNLHSLSSLIHYAIRNHIVAV